MKTIKIYSALLVTFILLPFVMKAQWSRITNSPAQVQKIYFYNAQIGYALKQNNIFKTIDGGSNWNTMPANFDSFTLLSDINFVSEDTGFVLASNNLTFAYPVSAYITVDGGNSWDTLLGPYDGGTLDFHFENSSTWYFHLTSHWFTPVDSIFQTSDAGASWMNTGSSSAVLYNQLIGNLILYKDSVTPSLAKLFYKSTDGGDTWNLLLTDTTENAGISDYQFLNNNDGYVLLYQYNGNDTIDSKIYKTTNGGLSWISYILPSICKDPQYMHFTSVNTGYITSHNLDQTRSELFKTTDAGITWNIDFVADSNEYFFNGIAEYYQYIYVLGNNIIRHSVVTSLKETNVVEINGTVFPNPFSSTAALNLKEELKNATLVVYNSFGQQVHHLKNVSGKNVTLYRNNLPSGIYYVSITENSKTIASYKLIIAD